MTVLLDTHFVLWIVRDSARLRQFPWLDRYRPWGVSPVSLLEIQFLAEVGRGEVRNPEFTNALRSDSRFVVDDLSFARIVQHAVPLTWTRDPFDRLLAAHSEARRTPLCTTDREIRANHRRVAPEILG